MKHRRLPLFLILGSLLFLPHTTKAALLGLQMVVERDTGAGFETLGTAAGEDLRCHEPLTVNASPGDTLRFTIQYDQVATFSNYGTTIMADDPRVIDYLLGSAVDLSGKGFAGFLGNPNNSLNDATPEAGFGNSAGSGTVIAQSLYRVDYVVQAGATADGVRDFSVNLTAVGSGNTINTAMRDASVIIDPGAGPPPPPPSDSDGDGFGDACDTCVAIANANQADADGDRRGDVCDNCPAASNPGQEETDGDGAGDLCDNCPGLANSDQADTDQDTFGDACDPFPQDPDNEQAQCEADLGQAQQDLAACGASLQATQGQLSDALDALERCLEHPTVPDADGDSETDGTDACPGTDAGADVDSAGCALAQFCQATNISGKHGSKNCQNADWKNDEPTAGKNEADCEVRDGACAPIGP